MHRTHWILAACAAAGTLVGQAADAQTYVNGSATGCFYTSPASSCSPSGSASTAGGLLTYSGASFSGTSVGGMLSLGGSPGTSNNFGSFTLGTLNGANTQAFVGTTFDLLLSFLSPAGAAPTTILAPITGTLASNGSSVYIDFGNNGLLNGSYTTTVNANGGSFQVTVFDVPLSPGSTNDVKGMVSGFQGSLVNVNAVPEPTSVALMATGLVGLVGIGGRRRRAVKG